MNFYCHHKKEYEEPIILYKQFIFVVVGFVEQINLAIIMNA